MENRILEILKKHLYLKVVEDELSGSDHPNLMQKFHTEFGGVVEAAKEISSLMLSKQRVIEQVKEFHTAFNLPQRSNPTIIPSGEFKCRHDLLQEEVDELFTAYNNNDIIEVADAIIDSIYVLIGTAVQFGLADKLWLMFDEVHRSNMSKLDENGKPVMREDGKVMKSNLFTPPNLKSIIANKLIQDNE
jgi:predicted HAD superfamily Cof-like phosphohydrolase